MNRCVSFFIFWALLSGVALSLSLDTRSCTPPPFCAQGNLSWRQSAYCRMGFAPMDETDYRKYVSKRLPLLLRRNVKGQDHVLEEVERDVLRKVRYPHEPLVMHFAGDNGVGKTSTAQWVSSALSVRCHKTIPTSGPCNMGENLLSLSGTGYAGHTSFREEIVKSILKHARQYPHGVVVFNDITALSDEQIRVLFPLLGRSAYFVEDPSVDLRLLTVIITTDFGSEGRTRGKSIKEVTEMVQEEVRTAWGSLAGSQMRTYAFLPAALDTIKQIVELCIADWWCTTTASISSSSSSSALGEGGGDSMTLTVEDSVIESLAHDSVSLIAAENGRAVRDAVHAALVNAEIASPAIDGTTELLFVGNELRFRTLAQGSQPTVQSSEL